MKEFELPSYSEELLKGQKPKYMLISCADSRVPKGELLTGFKYLPGEVFTISNAGNCYLLNLETFYYGVLHLSVEKVIVCGHNNCGMMKAVINGRDENPHIQEAINTIRETVFGGTLPTNDVDELAKENVHRQIEMMMKDDAIKSAMNVGTLKKLLGLYYDFSSGIPELYLINVNGQTMEEKIKWDELRDKL
uniref:carbonic anhydrase n=1 Tax=Geoglobus ahangari TaxID=113653 RepID=A0A7C4W2Z8_9EURY